MILVSDHGDPTAIGETARFGGHFEPWKTDETPVGRLGLSTIPGDVE